MLTGDTRKVFTRADKVSAVGVKFQTLDEDLLEPFTSISEQAKKYQAASGPHFAILIEFDLVKSSYATMLIREFCHVSSSFENQELINQQGEQNKAKEMAEEMDEDIADPEEAAHMQD